MSENDQVHSEVKKENSLWAVESVAPIITQVKETMQDVEHVILRVVKPIPLANGERCYFFEELKLVGDG